MAVVLIESKLELLNDWIRRREYTKGLYKLVWVGPPRIVKRSKFDLYAPCLAPPNSMRKRFEELREKNIRIASGMRSWGETEKERLLTAEFKAFKDAYGPDAVYYRRYLRRLKRAQEAISKIRNWLKKKFNVILISPGRTVARPSLILMSIILRKQDLAKLLREAGYFFDRDIKFAEYIQKQVKRRPFKTV